MNDIVYILKHDVGADELRYSLRSVCENFPFNRIWFYCGCPEGIHPDRHIAMNQIGISPWQKVAYTLDKVCKNNEITEDFWLFNDDFFVMHPVEDLPPIYDKTLYRRIEQIKERNGGDSLYSRELEKVRQMLMDEGYHTFNYAVHMPMLINRKKALTVLHRYSSMPMFRSLYGNVMDVGGINRPDCKIFLTEEEPTDTVFLSTTETSFKKGKVGAYIRERFPNRCRYED